MAGDKFAVVDDAMEAREIAQKRQRLEREAQEPSEPEGHRRSKTSCRAAQGRAEWRTLRIIIKADQGGPAEALADALGQLCTSEVQVDVIHRGVGAITESDILLAKASGAIILGFHVRPDNNARATAEREGVDVRTYRIIYEAVEDVRNALEGLLKPEEREVVLGEAEVRELFKVRKVGTIAGCSVRSGVISGPPRRASSATASRSIPATSSSLKRFKDDVREVREGFECGIGIENFNDLKVGDVIESFRMEEVKRTLAGSAASGGRLGCRRSRSSPATSTRVDPHHDHRRTNLGPPPSRLPVAEGQAQRAEAALLGAPAVAQRVGRGDGPPGPLAARRDRVCRRGHRRARWSRRFCARPIG